MLHNTIAFYELISALKCPLLLIICSCIYSVATVCTVYITHQCISACQDIFTIKSPLKSAHYNLKVYVHT